MKDMMSMKDHMGVFVEYEMIESVHSSRYLETLPFYFFLGFWIYVDVYGYQERFIRAMCAVCECFLAVLRFFFLSMKDYTDHTNHTPGRY